jgi:hypothetical protein
VVKVQVVKALEREVEAAAEEEERRVDRGSTTEFRR